MNRSEVLRLLVDRYFYLESIAAPVAEQLVEKYRPVFQTALADLTFDDFKVAVRSLPAIVMGAMAEEHVREPVEREHQTLGLGEMIDWSSLKTEIEALNPSQRLRVLDYVTGRRYLDLD